MGGAGAVCVSNITKAVKTIQKKQLPPLLELTISELRRCTSSTKNQLHLCF